MLVVEKTVEKGDVSDWNEKSRSDQSGLPHKEPPDIGTDVPMAETVVRAVRLATRVPACRAPRSPRVLPERVRSEKTGGPKRSVSGPLDPMHFKQNLLVVS